VKHGFTLKIDTLRNEKMYFVLLLELIPGLKLGDKPQKAQ
jgi:hypothetical protein